MSTRLRRPEGASVKNAAGQFHIDKPLPSYWRVTSDTGPVNLLDPDTIEQLSALVRRIETCWSRRSLGNGGFILTVSPVGNDAPEAERLITLTAATQLRKRR